MTIYVCETHFMTSPLWLVIGLVSIRGSINTFLNVCPFDNTTVAVSGKVGIPSTGLATPVA